jgi:uncharacterized membrane protein
VQAMSYEDVLDNVAKVVEGVGAAILVLGGVTMLALYMRRLFEHTPGAYTELRRNLGRVILLGLEILIIGDIIRTIAVDPTLENVAVLGLIVIIRILLSFSLEVEIDGAWPWNRWKTQKAERPADPG